ncbi:similar to Saccharomyces cerevisiae YGR161C RTS3 Putative component of the protein phosphatase type 2A complex [Maudiozyma saulgeensis]|uniref:Similar to Saccharomyces cerevisiae YGR161C RTS3 Putative component of the protein phosphatase type 2A complex n=1 Tax=Maudiozyma saulgeensis TaxID=1789683 RepID=A0A1X7R9D8_9SACH|nr:similar to Saccharomyces cerevisiae YGR161C RTS3 Putative component of the protein phosphatase type 2A complex [Kazachstania saulgeensis]
MEPINNFNKKNKRSLSQTSQYYTNSKLSCEEIINKMENEQDAIVVRLLREINYLKNENNKLRNKLNQNKFRRYSTGTRNIDNDQVIIDDDDDDEIEHNSNTNNNELLSNLPLTPRRSFNNNSSYSTPISSRRPSNVNSNTIFPIHTPSTTSTSSSNINSISGNFLRPKNFTFSHISTNSSSSGAVGMENLSINQNKNNRKRRTSSTVSLENNPHFKNHEKKVNEILPLR